MENTTMFLAMTSAVRLPLGSALSACATSALPAVQVPGIAVRATAPNAAFAPFAALAAAVATDAVKRERAHAGMGRRGTTTAVFVPGSLAWSPPI